MATGLETRLPFSASVENQVCEYLLLAHPSPEVSKKIQELNQLVLKSYMQTNPWKFRPVMLLASFIAVDSMEETLIRYLHRVCAQHKSFTITLNNFGGCPPNGIYVRVQESEPFTEFARELKAINQYLQSNGYPEAKITTRPQLTISRSFEENLYREVMLDFSQRTFHESFLLNEMVLVKRKGQYDVYSQVNVFGLYPPDTNN